MRGSWINTYEYHCHYSSAFFPLSVHQKVAKILWKIFIFSFALLILNEYVLAFYILHFDNFDACLCTEKLTLRESFCSSSHFIVHNRCTQVPVCSPSVDPRQPLTLHCHQNCAHNVSVVLLLCTHSIAKFESSLFMCSEKENHLY